MTTLTGILRDSGGNPITGSLWLELSQPGIYNPGAILVTPLQPSTFTLTNGQITGPGPGPYQVYGNDGITPSSTWYALTAFDSSGQQVLRVNTRIEGASVDLGSIPIAPTQNWNPPVDPSATLAGDVTGPLGATVVQRIRGRAVAAPPWTPGHVLAVQGDGSLAFGAAAGGVADGDKGDITVTGSGATWTIDPNAVTYAKLQNVSATSRILGRVSAGAGDVEELTGAQVLALAGGAAVSHAHAAADITSGTLPVTRGGTGVDMWPNVVGGGDQGNIVFTTGHSTPLTASQKLYAIPEVGSPTENVGVFLNYRRYFAGNQPPSAPLHVVANIGADSSPEERVVAMFGANANLSIYGQRRTVSVMMGHAPDGTDQGKLLPESSGRLSYSWDHPVWNAGPIPASPYTQEFFISVPTALGSPTKILGCKGDGTVNAYHGLNVVDGKLWVEAKKGLIDTGDCALQVTSEVVAGAGERAAVYLQGLGTGGYAALKMGCLATTSEYILTVGDGISGLQVKDTNAGATRLQLFDTTGAFRLLGNVFVGETPSATPRSRLEITNKLPSIATGYGTTLRVNSGAEPNYLTPGANSNIAIQGFANNASINDVNLWGLNLVVGQGGAPLSAPTPPASGIHVVGAEVEVFNRATSGNAQLDPIAAYPSKIRANGLEVIGHSGSDYRNAGAFVAWANDATGAKWWDTGLCLSRTYSYGIRFRKIAGDSVNPFQTAIFDLADLTLNPQPFARCSSSADTRLDFFNDADHSIYLNLDAGGAAADETALLFSDRGTRKWFLGKNASNQLQIGFNNGASAISAFSAYVDDEGTPTKALISFYGQTPLVARQTVSGSRGGNAALAALLTALGALGLITDGSSA